MLRSRINFHHVNSLGHQPSAGNIIRTLKDGYWDRTEVVALAADKYRVRKRSKGAAFGPWGIASLRREIMFLRSLPPAAAAVFPPVLATWDNPNGGNNDVGYEMPFYADHLDAGVLAREKSLTQDEIDEFQDMLADTVFNRLHEPVPARDSLADHIASVIDQAWCVLEKDPALARLIAAPNVVLNGQRATGLRKAFEQIRRETDALPTLDAASCVRLHGDFFLENILWRPAHLRPTTEAPRLLLIDPVSVAGVMWGPPVFDLVKYISYATGELLALRSEWVDTAAEESTGVPRYRYHIRWEDAELQPFRARDWHTRFSRAFELKHGPVDRRLYELIDGYFSVAMAVNTSGAQRHARLLKATASFNAVLAVS